MYLALTVAGNLFIYLFIYLVAGNDDLPEDDDNASVVEGVVGDIESSGCIGTMTEITNEANEYDVSISKYGNEASYQHR